MDAFLGDSKCLLLRMKTDGDCMTVVSSWSVMGPIIIMIIIIIFYKILLCSFHGLDVNSRDHTARKGGREGGREDSTLF